MTKVIETLTECRQIAWNEGFLDVTSRLRKSGMTFVKCMALNVQQLENSISTPVNTSNRSIQFNLKLGHLGKSSFETTGGLQLVSGASTFQETDKIVNVPCFSADFNMVWVYTSKDTRRTEKLPDWFIEDNKSCQLISKSAPISVPGISQVTNKESTPTVFTKKFLITDEFIDKFGHTNYVSYIKFIVESIRCFDKASSFGKTTLLDLPLTKLDILYHGESGVNDILSVALLLLIDKDCIVAHIMKEEGVLCSCAVYVKGLKCAQMKSKI